MYCSPTSRLLATTLIERQRRGRWGVSFTYRPLVSPLPKRCTLDIGIISWLYLSVNRKIPPYRHLLFGGATLDDVGQPQLVACKAIYFSVVFTLKKWFLFNGTFGIIGAMEHTETPNGATIPIELPDRVWEKIFPVLSGNYWLNHKLT